MIYRAEDADLSDFDIKRVSYKNNTMFTEAVQVTIENIGGLSIEFETGLSYGGGVPYFQFLAQRGTEDEKMEPTKMHIVVGLWIIVLWNELHLFHDREFQNTFTIVESSAVAEMDAGIKTHDEIRQEVLGGKTVGELREELKGAPQVAGYSPDATQVMPAAGKLTFGPFTEEQLEPFQNPSKMWGPNPESPINPLFQHREKPNYTTDS